jgi:energy-coupling factor transporter ATP-binding protein EcfA2
MTEGPSVTAAAAHDPGTGAVPGASPAPPASAPPESAEVAAAQDLAGAAVPDSAGPTHEAVRHPVGAGQDSVEAGQDSVGAGQDSVGAAQNPTPPALAGGGAAAQNPAGAAAHNPAGAAAQNPAGAAAQNQSWAAQALAGAARARAEAAQALAEDEEIEPHVRVDARLIESAILALRKPIVAASLPLEAPGVDGARVERHKLLSQIDDYLLPRLRESGAPILVALVGSTGAGKSTLVNSIVGAHVSMTGIRRPTTNSPVLACHPDDVGWFAENVFLPTVPRVRQEGLARSGKDGLLVLAANEGMPKGVALLDTPDIDSVVQAHHEFAHQFLDASDLWLFMTTAARYADATVWELLQHARDRGAALAIVLSRVPPAAGPEVVAHFHAMLEANGLGGNQRFLIPETILIDGKLPPAVCGPVRDWLKETADQPDRRVAILTQTMSGVLDTFRTRVPALAAQIESQVTLRTDLTTVVAAAYQVGLAEIDQKLQDGSLMSGEVLARWQDFAGTGDLLRTLQSRRGGGSKQRRHRSPARTQALKAASRTAIESLITSVADRAAENCLARWREHPAGSALLGRLTAAGDPAAWQGSEFAAEADLIFGWDAGGTGAAQGALDDGNGSPRERPAALGRSSADLATRAARAVSAWQDQVAHIVHAENVTKRSIARAVSLDEDSLAAVLMIGLLGSGEDNGSTAAIPHRLLTSLFGAGPLREIEARTRGDLRHRITLIFDEEMRRFADVINAVGTPDAMAGLQLYQATYALEVAR